MAANPWLNPSSVLRFASCIFPLSALLPVAAIAQSQPHLFPIANFLPIGAVSTPATGDFNSDGQPDLIFSSPTAAGGGQFASLTVLLNQGATSNPTPVITNSLGCTSVTSLAVADMNNDNKLDVVLTCPEGFVAILFGNGDGTFQKPAYYSVPTTSLLIPPADLNADGFPDIAIANASSVAVLLNQGRNSPGTLSSPTSYPAPPIQFRLLGTGDFDGDGKPDLLGTANADSPGLGFQLITYAGYGDGTFQSPQTQSTTTSAGAAVIADVNHDGFSDVVYIASPPAAGEPQVLQVLLGNSAGQFTLGSSLSLDPSINYTSLAFAGSTNNGININLALGGLATTILLGDGKGGFTAGQTYAITGSPLPETGSNGKTNLVFVTETGIALLPGNGDGTFQGLPNLPVGPTGFVAADFNRDGFTDIAFIGDNGNLTTAVGRGDGTLAVTSQIPATAGEFLLAADFNADGRPDIAAILPGVPMQEIFPDSQLIFYKGNGDGTFQSPSTGIDLHITGAVHAATGDFNGDGHLDIVVSAIGAQPNQGLSTQAILAVPGNGDGSFGTPVLLATQSSFNPASSLLASDLNNDRRTDLIWNNIVFLGQSDGSFLQQPLGLLGTSVAIGDLNGDGIPDIVIQPPSVGGNTPGPTVYAGLGDGTFQTTPLFAVPTLPSGTAIVSALIGDVNADGHPDLLIETRNPDDLSAQVNVYLGDGKGNFIADPNTYTAGSSIEGLPAMESSIATFARLNNQAPALPNDNTPDFLTFTSAGATSLLNQFNPPPSPPALIQSRTTLAISAATANTNQQLILTATVTGANPTGTVTFVSGNTALGTASLTSGTATLSVSFTAVGAYSILANYSGDNTNLPSTSNTLSITITIPDFTLTADRIAQLVNRGQPVTTTVTVAPLNGYNGYNGTVDLACTALPAETTCSFAPSSLAPATGPATATVTINTTPSSITSAQSEPPPRSRPLPPIIWAAVIACLALSPKRPRRNSLRSFLFALASLGVILTLTACSSSPAAANPASPTHFDPGTPTGIQSITITATDSTGKPSHSMTLQITVQ
jgi:Bacterial Ig-like domain (group 3)/FG-GAP-like repeat